jgi:hypothetical protein
MFQRIEEYPVVEQNGWWRPRAYGDLRVDGRWDGWLVFFPRGGGLAVAPPDPETTQSTLDALALWAAGLTPVYLEGALTRALSAAERPGVISDLADAEYEALHDAERLESAAELERVEATLDEAAADAARGDAEVLRRERRAAERALATHEEAAARLEAAVHESAPRDARELAADAAKRRRSAGTANRGSNRAPRRSGHASKQKKREI